MLTLPKHYTGGSLQWSTRALQEQEGQKEAWVDREIEEGVKEINIHSVPSTRQPLCWCITSYNHKRLKNVK